MKVQFPTIDPRPFKKLKYKYSSEDSEDNSNDSFDESFINDEGDDEEESYESSNTNDTECNVSESYGEFCDESYDDNASNSLIPLEFEDLLESIYGGDFFSDIKESKDLDLIKVNLESISKSIKSQLPTIREILECSSLDALKKKELLSDVYNLLNCDFCSKDYNYYFKNLAEFKNPLLKDSIETPLNTSIENLSIIKKYTNRLIDTKPEDSEYSDTKRWLKNISNVPFGIYCNHSPNDIPNGTRDYLLNIQKRLDQDLSFLDEPKDKILSIIAKELRSGKSNGMSIGLVGVKGIGKCMGKGTPILMYNGDIKPIENIVVNDVLMGDDSTERYVTSIVNGQDTMYKIKHVITGDSYIVNSQHILTLKNTYKPQVIVNNKTGYYKFRYFDLDTLTFKNIPIQGAIDIVFAMNIMDTKDDTIDVSIQDYLALSKKKQHFLKGISTGIDYSHIDTTSTLSAHHRHLDISPYVYAKTKLKYLIPNQYKFGKRNDRLSFLAGIIDGLYQNITLYHNNNMTTTLKIKIYNEILIKDVIILINSIGGIYCKKINDELILFGDGLFEIPSRELPFNFSNDQDIFTTSRIEITRLEIDDYYGFEITGNKRYIIGNSNIITHNTSIASSIAKALDRPFKIIPLGGTSDSTSLTGHASTYIGSTPGKIVNALIESKCMNPVIVFDECDKTSGDKTNNNSDMTSALIHLTDTTTNSKWNHDHYFANIEFDCSNIIKIFTFNNRENIDPILLDRMCIINLSDYTISEKKKIIIKHFIPKILSEYNFTTQDIIFPDDVIHELCTTLNNKEHGMRLIRQNIDTIVSRINMLLYKIPSKLGYNSLLEKYKELPIHIRCKDLRLLCTYKPVSLDDQPPPHMYI